MVLFWRIWAAVTVVTFAVLSIFVGLAILQFDQIHSGLLGERLVVLAGRVAAPFDAAARIGLPLPAVRNAAALLERARQTDDFIAAIHVFDAEGRVVHSTEASPPAVLPPEAIAARADAGGAPWHRETAQGFLGSVNIAGRGDAAGGILVVYPRKGNVTRVWAMAAELALIAIAVLIGAAALGGLVLRLGLARQIAAFETIDRAVAAFECDSWRGAAGGRTRGVDEDADGLRQMLDAADARYRSAGQIIADAQGDAAR